jgi:alpha-glucosidase (family GH31 glycosyl hydrolase)
MPFSNQHFDGKQFLLHRDVHNAYGLMMQRATYQALQARGKLPFLLSRSTFIGG